MNYRELGVIIQLCDDDVDLIIDNPVEFVLDDSCGNVEIIFEENDNYNDTTLTISVAATFISSKTIQMIDDDQFFDSLMNINTVNTPHKKQLNAFVIKRTFIIMLSINVK